MLDDVLAYGILGIVALGVVGIVLATLWVERGFVAFITVFLVVPAVLIVWALHHVGLYP